MTEKKIEALFELYNSEDNYVSDLFLWSVKFNKSLRNEPSIDPRKANYLCNLFFNDLKEILNLHQSNLQELKPLYEKNKESFINNSDELEELTLFCFDKTIASFDIYLDYVKNLSKIDFTFKNEMEKSTEFSNFVGKFFIRNQIDKLGFNHFIYEPFIKLTRYPLLLKALKKRIVDTNRNIKLEIIINKLENFLEKVDWIYSKEKGDFRIFILSKVLKNKLMNKPMPNLFLLSSKRILFDERDLFCRLERNKAINLYRVIILDNYTLFCDVVAQRNKEVLYLVEYIEHFRYLYEIKEEKIADMEPNECKTVKIFDIQGKDEIILIFKQEKLMAAWIELFSLSIYNTLKYFSRDIKIVERRNLSENVIKYVSKPYECKNYDTIEKINYRIFANINFMKKNEALSIDMYTEKREEEEYSVMLNEVSEIIMPGPGSLEKIYLKTNLLDFKIKIEKLPTRIDEANIFIIVHQVGLVIVKNNTRRFISPIFPTKIIYDPSKSLMSLIINRCFYISPFNSNSTRLDLSYILNYIDDFSYISNENECFLFLSRNSMTENAIYSFDILISNNSIELCLRHKYIIPCTINNVNRFNNNIMLIGTSESFLSINTDPSIQKNLILNDNIFRNFYFFNINEMRPKMALKMQDGNLMLCFENFGYIVDGNNFRIIEPCHMFTWEPYVHDFRIHKNYFIILGRSFTYIYDLSTSALIFYDCSKTFRFVENDTELLLFSCNVLFELILP